jgi:predicted dehydrogenase
MQLGIHGFDLLHYLLNPVVEVAGYARSVMTPPPVVDNVVAVFRLSGGATGTMVSNYCTQVTFEYRISGTEGTLQCTPHRLRYRSMAGEKAEEEHDFSEDDRESYRRQMEIFRDAVRDRRPPETDGWAGLQALAVVEALGDAIRTNSPVAVLPQAPAAYEK